MRTNKQKRDQIKNQYNGPFVPSEDLTEIPLGDSSREGRTEFLLEFPDLSKGKLSPRLLEAAINDALSGTGRYILATACNDCDYVASKEGFRSEIERTVKQDIPFNKRIIFCPMCGKMERFVSFVD